MKYFTENWCIDFLLLCLPQNNIESFVGIFKTTMRFWAKRFTYFANQAVGKMPEEDKMVCCEEVIVEIVISKDNMMNIRDSTFWWIVKRQQQVIC